MISETPQQKVARLARLRRDGGVLRDYRAPRWDEPFIMEQGTPGERGILVPLAEDEVTAAWVRPWTTSPRGWPARPPPTCPRCPSTRSSATICATRR